MESKSGSVRVFIREDERFTVHEPHGKREKIVSKQARKNAINALIRLGLLGEDD